MRKRQSEPDAERELQQLFQQQHAELYWLAYLLTADRELSLRVVIEAVEGEETPRAFFETWMTAWARRLVIARALAGMGAEIATSARRVEAVGAELSAARVQMPAQPVTRLQLERALLGIDLFPRCVLLLTVFERVSAHDAAILLNSDQEQIRRAKSLGLHQLTRNIAQVQAFLPASAAAGPVFQYA